MAMASSSMHIPADERGTSAVGPLPWEVGPTAFVTGRVPHVLDPFRVHMWQGPVPAVPAKPKQEVLPQSLDQLGLGQERPSHPRAPPVPPPECEVRVGLLRLWAGVARVVGSGCQLGKHLSKVEPGSEAEVNMMENVFASKATNTLKRRVGAISRFLRWSQLKAIPMPELFGEDNVYGYVEELRASAAPTSPSSFLEALAFAYGLLGLDMDLGKVRSSRVSGAAVRAFGKSRLLP